MRLRTVLAFSLACAFCLLLIPKGAHAVRQDNLILCSAVQGQILDGGQPVSGQKVKRLVHWNMEKEPRVELTTTNADGQFQFPEIKGSADFGVFARLFHVPVISIRIYVPIEKSEYMAYATSRNSYKKSDETGLTQIGIKCDLQNKTFFNDRLPVIDCKVEESHERKSLNYD